MSIEWDINMSYLEYVNNKTIKNKIYNLSLSLVLTVFLGACSDKPSAPEVKMIATVNNAGISEQQFNAYLKLKRINSEDTEAVDKALDNYLSKEALANVIQKQNLLDYSEIEAETNEFKKQMLLSRYFEKFLSEKVTEEAARNFYTSNITRYQKRQVHVAHLLVRTNQKMSEAERQALLTKTHEAYSKARAGEAFDELVKQYSDDKLSAKKGGDLGWITEGAIDPLFSQTAFGLNSGEMSEPISTPFGFHILKVLDAAKVVTQPYEVVAGDIRYELRQKAKLAEIQRLKESVKIEKYEISNDKS